MSASPLSSHHENPEGRLHRAILKTFEDETRRIVDEEAKAAAARVEERVRALAGQIAVRTATWVRVDSTAPQLQITIRIPDRDKDLVGS